jgi:hypothetical protein
VRDLTQPLSERDWGDRRAWRREVDRLQGELREVTRREVEHYRHWPRFRVACGVGVKPAARNQVSRSGEDLCPLVSPTKVSRPNQRRNRHHSARPVVWADEHLVFIGGCVLERSPDLDPRCLASDTAVHQVEVHLGANQKVVPVRNNRKTNDATDVLQDVAGLRLRHSRSVMAGVAHVTGLAAPSYRPPGRVRDALTGIDHQPAQIDGYVRGWSLSTGPRMRLSARSRPNTHATLRASQNARSWRVWFTPSGARVASAAERVVAGNLDEDDADAVLILDPSLEPHRRLAEHTHSGSSEPLILGTSTLRGVQLARRRCPAREAEAAMTTVAVHGTPILQVAAQPGAGMFGRLNSTRIP